MIDQQKKDALDYHQFPRPGKISVSPTKPMGDQLDLSLAYSPGVAHPCEEIVKDPTTASLYTSRSNLVGVVSNGTAVLGLGNIGALAAKPVMEGKGCLFKAFAGIDVFDIELDESDPDELVDAIAMMEPTLGGINLEDIKAPECFYIEEKLRERMQIPVFHDDQHGTAIISSAAIINALELVKKDLGDARLVCSGAGAAAIACLNLLVKMGLRKENITLLDSKGVVTKDREHLDATKKAYAIDSERRTLEEALVGADVFLGVSAAGLLKPDMLKTMAASPVILALANPEPEVRPEVAKAARPDCIIATGRSDYANQVNNVLCFPYIFRGALDVGATAITEDMKIACVKALADLTRETASTDKISQAYGGHTFKFGPDYIIPKPFDPRLISAIAPEVARCAMESGIATKTDFDVEAYREELSRSIYRTGMIMRPYYEHAREACASIVFAEGNDPRVHQALLVLCEQKLAKPILIGDEALIEASLEDLSSPYKRGEDYSIIARDYGSYAGASAQGYDLIKQGVADGMICGLDGPYHQHLEAFAPKQSRGPRAAMNLLMLDNRNIFICDTYINEKPEPEVLAQMGIWASEEVKKFGITPKVALVSNSYQANYCSESYDRMIAAETLLREKAPDLAVGGVMQADAALSEKIRHAANPDSGLEGEANVLLMPNIDSANITYNILKIAGGEGVTVGPFLLGQEEPIEVLTPAATVRRIVNMSTVVSSRCA